ncbi:hypothetical protein DVH05_005150 [Phytophthora capsici]|nr:hypothetical protein DVH05_005150 [Phytophthora capsici]
MARGRKASPGSLGRRPNAYKRDCETFGKKLDVINFYSQHGMQATLAKYYSHLADTSLESKRKRILEWKNNRTMIESMASTTTGAQLKSARKKGSGTTISRIGEEARYTTAMISSKTALVKLEMRR